MKSRRAFNIISDFYPMKKHPKNFSSLDPTLLLPDDMDFTAYRRRIFRNRTPLFKVFQELIPFPECKITELEYKQTFTDFVFAIVCDYQISYGLIMSIFHTYLIYWSATRFWYSPELGTLWTFNGTSTRVPSLVDFCGIVQFWIYTITFAARVWRKWIDESYLLFYSTFLMNANLLVAFWCVYSSDKFLLSGSKFYGTWNAVYIPIIYWWIYLFSIRNRLSIAGFEVLKDVFGGPLERDGLRIERAKRLVHRIWVAFTPLYILAVYRYFIISSRVFMFEVLQAKPQGIFLIAFICICSSLPMSIWYSYLMFQIKIIHWKADDEAIIILNFEEETKIGLVH